MKVRELIEALSKQNPDDLVVLSQDAEGNGYSSVWDLAVSYVEPDYTGGRLEGVLSAEDIEDDSDEDYGELDDYTRVVTIWPV